MMDKEDEKADPVSTYAQDNRLRQSLQRITNMTEMFQLLRDYFSRTKTVWENFCAERGDICYFADLKDRDAKSALHRIEECFEKMKEYELTLKRLQHNCEQYAEMVILTSNFHRRLLTKFSSISN